MSASYNPYAPDWHQEAPPDITLAEYAAAWIDMEPHIGQLTELAGSAQVIVEFGIRGGVSTWALLDGLPADGRLTGVDVRANAPIPLRVKNDPRFTFVAGNSLQVDLPDHADLVMIDTSHEYLQTALELARSSSLGSATIALHDYFSPEYPGVAQAVTEFVDFKLYRLKVVYPSRYGLAVLERV